MVKKLHFMVTVLPYIIGMNITENEIDIYRSVDK